jgi:hypothetical protein
VLDHDDNSLLRCQPPAPEKRRTYMRDGRTAGDTSRQHSPAQDYGRVQGARAHRQYAIYRATSSNSNMVRLSKTFNLPPVKQYSSSGRHCGSTCSDLAGQKPLAEDYSCKDPHPKKRLQQIHWPEFRAVNRSGLCNSKPTTTVRAK